MWLFYTVISVPFSVDCRHGVNHIEARQCARNGRSGPGPKQPKPLGKGDLPGFFSACDGLVARGSAARQAKVAQ
jgi:hypothetical protein